MACDHFDPKTYANAMNLILEEYNNLHNEFTNNFKTVIEDYYNAWQSPKGWTKISNFHQWFSRSFVIASKAIVENYNIMLESSKAYAASQDFMLSGVYDIKEKNFTVEEKQSFDKDGEIIINRDKISEVGQQLEISLQNMLDCIENSLSQTETDSKFGYYSVGDSNNPRESINRAYSSLLVSLKNATKQFQLRFAEILEEDRIAAEKAKTSAAVQNNDFSDIFN